MMTAEPQVTQQKINTICDELQQEALPVRRLSLCLGIVTALLYIVAVMMAVLLLAQLLVAVLPVALSIIVLLGPVLGAFIASPVFTVVASMFIGLTLVSLVQGKSDTKSQSCCALLNHFNVLGCWQRKLIKQKASLFNQYNSLVQRQLIGLVKTLKEILKDVTNTNDSTAELAALKTKLNDAISFHHTTLVAFAESVRQVQGQSPLYRDLIGTLEGFLSTFRCLEHTIKTTYQLILETFIIKMIEMQQLVEEDAVSYISTTVARPNCGTC